jgi:hypothetical protein
MFEPLVSRTYAFQRRVGERTVTRQFTRYADGSAYVVGDDCEMIYEGDHLVWQEALRVLGQEGFEMAQEGSE